MPNRRRTPAAASTCRPTPHQRLFWRDGITTFIPLWVWILPQSRLHHWQITSHQPSLPGASYVAALSDGKPQQFRTVRLSFHHFIVAHPFSINLDCPPPALLRDPASESITLGSRRRDTWTNEKVSPSKLAILRYLRTKQLEHTQDPYASSPLRLPSS